jgi:hypothetical protein
VHVPAAAAARVGTFLGSLDSDSGVAVATATTDSSAAQETAASAKLLLSPAVPLSFCSPAVVQGQ